MNIAVRYQSRGGNTKAVAEVIARTAGVTAEPCGVPVTEPVDLLFIGGGVYKWDIDAELKAFLERLDPATVKSVAAFSTAGGMDGTKKITALLKERGITVREETLPVKVLGRNHAWLGGKGSITLSEKEVATIEDFVRKLAV
ncbi:MAG: flavodoxin family protein [Clostridiales Family XIII bacterium]|jgi:flavodoxin|nr:flavodoxin family protein [Clostridiales Family XIII bacterium]